MGDKTVVVIMTVNRAFAISVKSEFHPVLLVKAIYSTSWCRLV